jgi:hypothetical protein
LTQWNSFQARFPGTNPIELIAIKVIAIIPYLVIITF